MLLSEKTTRTALFRGEMFENPQTVLLNNTLGILPKEQQVAVITETLIATCKRNKGAIPLVEALERLFAEDGVGLRAHLIEVCARIPQESEKTWGRDFRESTAPELHLSILGRIIRGWPGREDAEACFDFLCSTLTTFRPIWEPSPRSKVAKGIAELFREHIRSGQFQAHQMMPWLLREGVPWDIFLVLNNARFRLGVPTAKKELKLLRALDLYGRSEGALELASNLLVKVREMDGLTGRLVAQIASETPGGDRNPEAAIPWWPGTVEFEVISLTEARVKITFQPRRPPQHFDYLATLAEIKKLREELVAGKEGITIKIEAQGPDDFCYKE